MRRQILLLLLLLVVRPGPRRMQACVQRVRNRVERPSVKVQGRKARPVMLVLLLLLLLLRPEVRAASLVL